MNHWFFYFLKKSILERSGRFVIASAAVMLTVTAVTALVTVSSGIRDKIGSQLSRYGANVIVTDARGGTISRETAEALTTLSADVRESSFQVYGTIRTGTDDVEVIGKDLGRLSGYRIYGRVPEAPNEAMAGVNLRDVLGLKEKGLLPLAGTKETLTITGFFERGSDEDSALIMPLAAAQKMLGLSGVSAVLLNMDTRAIAKFEQDALVRFPQLRTKTLRQVAVAEEQLLEKVRLLMFLVTAVVFFSSVIALGSTMGATVIERIEEIALMQSLGAAPGRIRALFLAEAALAGTAGSVAGYAAGFVAAEAVSKTAFGEFVPISIAAGPLALVCGILIAALTAYFPIRNVMKLMPAKILRGDQGA